MKRMRRFKKMSLTPGLLAVCLLLFCTLSGMILNADIAPRGDWRLNGNTLDDGYNGNNGEFVGSAVFDTGIYGQAANFTGSNYIKIPNYANFNNMTAFTLSAWVYPTINTPYNSIISKVNPNRDFDLQLTNGKINVHFAYGGSYYSCTSDNQVPLNQWSYVTAVWTGERWQIYYNGALVKEAAFPGKAPVWTGTNMGIGTMDFWYNFKGRLDEVKVFDTALNANNIKELYDIGLRTTNITITCDNEYELYVNGNFIGSGSDWTIADKHNLTLVPGKNVIAVQAWDWGGWAGLLADLQCEGTHIGTDFNWKVSTTYNGYWNATSYDDSTWAYASDFGRYGVSPWSKSVAGMPVDTDARWIWQGATNVNPKQTEVYYRLEINVIDNPDTGRLIEIMDPRPTTGSFTGVDYQVKSNVQDMPAAIKSRLVTKLKSTAIDGIEEPDSGTLYIPADEFSSLKSTTSSGIPAVNDVFLATDIERALRIRSSSLDSATGNVRLDYVKADVAEVFEYYDIPMQAVEITESNYVPDTNLKSSSSGTYTKDGNKHIYSFSKVLLDVKEDGFIAKVEIAGKLTLTEPKLTGQYKRNKYDFKFTAGEAAEIKLTGNVQLKKEVKVPLYGFNIDAGLGKVTIGIFIVLGIDGKVTFEYGIMQSITVEAGIKGKSFLYIPTSFDPYSNVVKNFSIVKKVEGKITVWAGLQPEVGLEICGKKIIGLLIFGGIEGVGTFDLTTYRLKIDALLKSVLSIFKKNIKLFEIRWNLVDESNEPDDPPDPATLPAPPVNLGSYNLLPSLFTAYWWPGSADTTGYKVYLNNVLQTSLISSSASYASYTFSGLNSDTSYQVSISATNSVGESGKSNITVTTPPAGYQNFVHADVEEGMHSEDSREFTVNNSVMAHIYINFYTDINDAGILNVYLEGPSYFSENLLTQAGGGLLEKNYYITLAPGSYTLRMSYSPRSGHESDYFYGNCDIEY